jgi:hypothetical protein
LEWLLVLLVSELLATVDPEVWDRNPEEKAVGSKVPWRYRRLVSLMQRLKLAGETHQRELFV